MTLIVYQILSSIIALAGLIWMHRSCLQPLKTASQSLVVGIVTAGAAGCAIALFPTWSGTPLTAQMRELLRIFTCLMLVGIAIAMMVLAATPAPQVKR